MDVFDHCECVLQRNQLKTQHFRMSKERNTSEVRLIPTHSHTFVYWTGGKEMDIVGIYRRVTATVRRYGSSLTRNLES